MIYEIASWGFKHGERHDVKELGYNYYYTDEGNEYFTNEVLSNTKNGMMIISVCKPIGSYDIEDANTTKEVHHENEIKRCKTLEKDLCSKNLRYWSGFGKFNNQLEEGIFYIVPLNEKYLSEEEFIHILAGLYLKHELSYALVVLPKITNNKPLYLNFKKIKKKDDVLNSIKEAIPFIDEAKMCELEGLYKVEALNKEELVKKNYQYFEDVDAIIAMLTKQNHRTYAGMSSRVLASHYGEM